MSQYALADREQKAVEARVGSMLVALTAANTFAEPPVGMEIAQQGRTMMFRQPLPERPSFEVLWVEFRLASRDPAWVPVPISGEGRAEYKTNLRPGERGIQVRLRDTTGGGSLSPWVPFTVPCVERMISEWGLLSTADGREPAGSLRMCAPRRRCSGSSGHLRHLLSDTAVAAGTVGRAATRKGFFGWPFTRQKAPLATRDG